MMNMRQKHGYMLLEVFLAMSIAVVAISITINIQLRSWLRVTRDHDNLEKIYLVKKELYVRYLSQPGKTKKTVTKLENPEIKITTQAEEIGPKSSLAMVKERIDIAKSYGEWKFENAQRTITMITTVPKPEPKKQGQQS
jgi:hypothetical protein